MCKCVVRPMREGVSEVTVPERVYEAKENSKLYLMWETSMAHKIDRTIYGDHCDFPKPNGSTSLTILVIIHSVVFIYVIYQRLIRLLLNMNGINVRILQKKLIKGR